MPEQVLTEEAAPTSMRPRRMMITPEVAASWLNRNVKNRPLSQDHVLFLAGVIERDEWIENGESIKFDVHGNLLDGQHRLEAVILADKPIVTLVVFGLQPEVFGTLDLHKKRSTSNYLALSGEHNCTSLAATLRLFQRCQAGMIMHNNERYQTSNQQLLGILNQHPGIRDSVDYVANTKMMRNLMPASAAGFLHYRFGQKDRKDCRQFFEALVSGAGLDEQSPIYRLRERLLTNRTNKAKLPLTEILAITIKAWNLFRAGKKCQVLVWRRGGLVQEPFPEIK